MIAQLDKAYIKARPTKIFNRLISYSLFEGRPLLTSGRWINPMVFGLFSLGKKLPQLKQVEKPVFILGTGRSGTTLLGVLLSMHKQVGFLNEPKALWHSLFPHEDIIGNYTSKKAYYRLTAEMVTPEIIKNAHKIYGFYLGLLGAQRVVDKYPELIFRTEFVKSIFPDAKFILIIRNGYDTCNSIDQWSKRKGRNDHSTSTEDWWGKDQRKWNLLIDQVASLDDSYNRHLKELKTIEDHKNKAALEWCLTMKEGAKLLSGNTKDIHVVKFEELCHEPEMVLRKILHFAELPMDEKIFSYARQVVKPVPGKGKFNIHPRLEATFHEMMSRFGYFT